MYVPILQHKRKGLTCDLNVTCVSCDHLLMKGYIVQSLKLLGQFLTCTLRNVWKTVDMCKSIFPHLLGNKYLWSNGQNVEVIVNH